MNLFKLHKDPKSLHNHTKAHDTVPELVRASEKFKTGELNPRQIATVLKDPRLAYNYLIHNRKDERWPEAEEAFAKDAEIA